MKPEDVAVWERYISAHPLQFGSVDYDVAVGDGVDASADHPENMAGMYKVLTQKKIDVVAYDGAVIYVIEVGPVADARKLGQILTYRALYEKTFAPDVPIIPVVICGAVEREMQDMFDRNGIVVSVA